MKKKILVWLLCAAMVMVFLPAPIASAEDNPFSGGKGIEREPYLISSTMDMVKLAQLVNRDAKDSENGGYYTDKYYRLTQDISGAGISEPIGAVADNNFASSHGFSGYFDGDGHVITGLSINKSESTAVGLFGYVYYGEIKDLGVKAADITGYEWVGGIAGYLCASSITCCYFSGTVNGHSAVGGVAGAISGGAVGNCYSTGAVNATPLSKPLVHFSGRENYLGVNGGGIMGRISSGTVEYCYSTAAVTTVNMAGGIVGDFGGNAQSVKNCAALNPGITLTGGTDMARVAAGSGHDMLFCNIANSAMQAYGANFYEGDGLNHANGKSLSGGFIAASGWGADCGFSRPWNWNRPNWTIQDGSLPILAGFSAGAQDGSLPEHLRTDSSAPPSVTASPTKSNVLINGVSVSFQAYLIYENNYFKLRDLAMVLSGTEKQFEVGWDGVNNTIVLTPGKAYTPVGGELTTSGQTSSLTAALSSSRIMLGDKPVGLTAYTISENNYFKLRDIARALDFYVGWDGGTNTISIDTTKGYSE